ncbi:MAG: CvpA family protein [Chitinispirillaceae bacterium]|nr:CvpA family protein [Chitinispirillaceae bacterium]
MHTLDILFCISAVFFIVVGIRRGLIGELFRLMAIIAGFLAAFLYYPDLAGILKISSPHVSTALSFSIIYALVFLLVIGAGWLLRRAVHLTPLGWFDYVFGGFIGLVKTAIIFWIVCLSFSTFPVTVKRMHLHRSAVYKTYNVLPAALTMDLMLKKRDEIRKIPAATVQNKLGDTRKNIEQIKYKVDSAKKAETKKR